MTAAQRTTQMELALPIDVDLAPSRKAYDRMVAYNGELLERHNDAHARMLRTGVCLGAWVDAWTEDGPPDVEHPASVALLQHAVDDWSIGMEHELVARLRKHTAPRTEPDA